MLSGATVAAGGVLTDSVWHVVFSSSSHAPAAIQPCAHQNHLHHPHIDTLSADSRTRNKPSHISSC